MGKLCNFSIRAVKLPYLTLHTYTMENKEYFLKKGISKRVQNKSNESKINKR